MGATRTGMRSPTAARTSAAENRSATRIALGRRLGPMRGRSIASSSVRARMPSVSPGARSAWPTMRPCESIQTTSSGRIGSSAGSSTKNGGNNRPPIHSSRRPPPRVRVEDLRLRFALLRDRLRGIESGPHRERGKGGSVPPGRDGVGVGTRDRRRTTLPTAYRTPAPAGRGLDALDRPGRAGRLPACLGQDPIGHERQVASPSSTRDLRFRTPCTGPSRTTRRRLPSCVHFGGARAIARKVSSERKGNETNPASRPHRSQGHAGRDGDRGHSESRFPGIGG